LPINDPGDGARRSFRSWFFGVTYAFPLLWLLGLGGLYWILLAAGSIGFLTRAKLEWLVWGTLAVAGSLAFSAPIGLIATDAGPARLFGLGANLAVWLATAAVVQLVLSGEESRGLTQVLAWVGFWQGAVTGLAVIAHPSTLPVPLLRAYASSVPGGFGAFMENNLYFSSWLGGTAYRSAGMMGQPTWAGAVALLALVSALHLLIRARITGWWRWMALGAIPLTVLSLVLSLSRAANLGIIIALVAAAFVAVRRMPGPAFLTLVIYAISAALIVALAMLPSIVGWVGAVNSERVGSFMARSDIYLGTWQMIQDHPFPVLGYGVKPEAGGLVAPLATHSMYLGLAFRGGLLGLAALVFVYGAILRRSITASSFWATFLIIFVAVWSVFEDMDPGHLVPLGLPLALAMALPKATSPTRAAWAEVRGLADQGNRQSDMPIRANSSRSARASGARFIEPPSRSSRNHDEMTRP